MKKKETFKESSKTKPLGKKGATSHIHDLTPFAPPVNFSTDLFITI